MAAALTHRECVLEQTTNWVWPRPVTFDEFLDLYTGREELVELVDGVVVEQDMVQLEHEKIVGWLYHLFALYADERELGILLGSRTAVRIGEYRGRLPDLVFVRQDRLDIVQQKAVFGTPDMVIEVISPGDRRANLIALETDYVTIGVPEIVFVYPQKRKVRVLRNMSGQYEETELTGGRLSLVSLPGADLELEWLFSEPRPTVRKLLDDLLGAV
jgi:Uma2 family endonuclease